VRLSVFASGIHRDDDLSLARAEDRVQSRRPRALGIVDEAHTRLSSRDLEHDLARRVHAHRVGDENLHRVARVVLTERGAQTGCDRRFIVGGRDRDGHEGAALHGERT
jgi:hypothetical protein